MTILLEERLRLCFNKAPWSYPDIKAAQEKIREDPNDQASNQLLRNAMSKLRSSTDLTLHIPDGIRDKIDETFRGTLGVKSVIPFFGNTDNAAYKSAYQTYKDTVVDQIRAHMEELDASGFLTTPTQDDKGFYASCWQKARFVLDYQNGPDIPENLPFMSASVWDVLCSHLKRIPKSLLEVRTLFSTRRADRTTHRFALPTTANVVWSQFALRRTRKYGCVVICAWTRSRTCVVTVCAHVFAQICGRPDLCICMCVNECLRRYVQAVPHDRVSLKMPSFLVSADESSF